MRGASLQSYTTSNFLKTAHIDPVSRVCIATIQRVYSILKGEELNPGLEEFSGYLLVHSPT